MLFHGLQFLLYFSQLVVLLRNVLRRHCLDKSSQTLLLFGLLLHFRVELDKFLVPCLQVGVYIVLSLPLEKIHPRRRRLLFLSRIFFECPDSHLNRFFENLQFRLQLFVDCLEAENGVTVKKSIQ